MFNNRFNSNQESTINKAGNAPIIPLIPFKKREKMTKVTLSNTVLLESGSSDRCKHSMPKAETSDIESILIVLLEYEEVPDQLGIDDWTVHADLFRECLGTEVRDVYDDV